MSIADNLAEVKGKLPQNVTLVAVSKTKPSSYIEEAYAAGQRIFGENRPLEMRDKHAELPQDIEWHMIGQLQTNKVKYIAPFVSLIHSVDRESVLREIQKRAAQHDRIIDVLIQVHIAQETTKAGYSIQEADELLSGSYLDQFPNVRVTGLMGMATNTSEEDVVSQEFESLNTLFEKHLNREDFQYLSMGMSNDYPIAISNGANMVRIGSTIFGARN
jgi:pyridoxal phosphate enzyme (YggS family)